jgi:hypothetical protein
MRFTTNQAEAKEKEKKVAERIKTNPKAFYDHANKSRTLKTKIGPLMQLRNGVPEYIAGPQRMTEVLSAQYQSTFTTPIPRSIPTFNLSNNDLLNDIDIKTKDMIDALRSISTWSTYGPDEVSPLFLKKFADEIAPALCALWRKSVDTGIMPDGINLAYITPIFKGGDKSLAKNYRPVALTNHITKAFEKIVKKEIVFHLAKHGLFNATQHGFRSGRSTLTNLRVL